MNPAPLLTCGIDLSCTATGLVLLNVGEKAPEVILQKEIIPKKLLGVERCMHICQTVLEVIHEWKPKVIVVEGYSLNMKNASSVIPLVELGGMLRFLMHLDGLSWYDPRATELKKFVTGKGGSAKDSMMMHTLKRWGFESSSNNICDAYGLACMGLAIFNRLHGVTLDQRKIVGELAVRSN